MSSQTYDTESNRRLWGILILMGKGRAKKSQKNLFFAKKLLTILQGYGIIIKRCEKRRKYGGVAQLARATGSYPVGHRFKSGLRYHFGPLVKRLRHRPFTAVTAVRFCYGSPKIDKIRQKLVDFYFFTITSSLFTKNSCRFLASNK